MVSCTQPQGTWALNGDDCYDQNSEANPGTNRSWQSQDRGDGSFDWNCDGVERKRYPDWQVPFDNCPSPSRWPGWQPLFDCADPNNCVNLRTIPECGEVDTWDEAPCEPTDTTTRTQLSL